MVKTDNKLTLTDSDFKLRNRDLFALPQDILADESQIHDLIKQITESDLSFAEKVKLIQDRELTPFIDGSRLRGEFRLLLEISDDLKSLRVFRLETTLSDDELNGEIDSSRLDKQLLVEVPEPRLLFSSKALNQFALGETERELAAQLYTLGRRLTTYRGVTVTWDQSVDNKVWTTNIDTVHMINQIANDGVFQRTDVHSAMEVGVGGGALSKTLLSRMPNLQDYTATDISPYALMCAKRNITPILSDAQRVNFYLGKGLKTIDSAVDLLVVNPPYIPHMLRPDATDPYRGTGLIKEVLELGLQRLNPANPNATIYLGMSSLAERDLAEYLKDAKGLKVEHVGTPLEVPLKIMKVNENKDWLEFLKREHGLVDSKEKAKETGFRFWQELVLNA